LLASGEIDESWCLVTDDVFPDDLRRHGHLDGLLRRLVAGGVRPEVAVRHASFVPARHYGLADRGAVAPGYRADLAVVDDLGDVRIEDGAWAFDPEVDVALIASIERHRASGRIGLGLVAGLGLRHPGALGSSVAHDSHNLIVAGTDARDLLACVRALAECGGG